MKRTANRTRAERGPTRAGRHARLGRPRDLGPAAASTLEFQTENPAWVLRAARVAIWALPGYAIAYLWLSARPVPDPVADPTDWAARVTSEGYRWSMLVAGLGGALLGLVAVVALAILLSTTRARWLGCAGLLVALAGATVQLYRHGVASLAAPALGEQVRSGDLAAAHAYQQAYAPAELLLGPVVLAGAVLVTTAWLLLALAVWRSHRFGRPEGLLLGLAAPLLGLGSGYLSLLAPAGALLLLAAGIGIAWSGRRWPVE